MKAYFAFVKKEFLEMARSYKLLIMGIVFFILGIMNPLTAKFTPEILKNFMPEGMQITINEPVVMDSWLQFYKNIPQMGLIVFVIVFSGIMSNELSKGTLINILTKGLSRKNVILAKFTSVSLVWSIAYFFCFAVSYFYTCFFWEDTVPNLLFSVICLWIFGILLVGFALLGGVLSKTNYGSLLITAIAVGVLLLFNIVPKFQEYNPIMLASSNTELLRQTKEVSDFIVPIVLTVIIIVASLVSSIAIFNKKKL